MEQMPKTEAFGKGLLFTKLCELGGPCFKWHCSLLPFPAAAPSGIAELSKLKRLAPAPGAGTSHLSRLRALAVRRQACSHPSRSRLSSAIIRQCSDHFGLVGCFRPFALWFAAKEKGWIPLILFVSLWFRGNDWRDNYMRSLP